MTGILVIDKPQDWTSFDVVNKLRGTLRRKDGTKTKVGHGGTLDPLATGVLPLFFGREYTRRVSESESADKEYVAQVRFGLTTDTQDITGSVLSRTEASVTLSELTGALNAFLGEISQVPPMYSAVKIGGQRLYEIARRGGEVERRPRAITVYEAEVLGGGGADWTVRFTVSKGTYIRTLCHDLGGSLGCGGVMSGLRRTRVGVFRIDDALSVEEAVSLIESGGIENYLIKDTLG